MICGSAISRSTLQSIVGNFDGEHSHEHPWTMGPWGLKLGEAFASGHLLRVALASSDGKWHMVSAYGPTMQSDNKMMSVCWCDLERWMARQLGNIWEPSFVVGHFNCWVSRVQHTASCYHRRWGTLGLIVLALTDKVYKSKVCIFWCLLPSMCWNPHHFLMKLRAISDWERKALAAAGA